MSSVSQLAAAEALTAATFLSGEGRSEACVRRRGGRGGWEISLRLVCGFKEAVMLKCHRRECSRGSR